MDGIKYVQIEVKFYYSFVLPWFRNWRLLTRFSTKYCSLSSGQPPQCSSDISL